MSADQLKSLAVDIRFRNERGYGSSAKYRGARAALIEAGQDLVIIAESHGLGDEYAAEMLATRDRLRSAMGLSALTHGEERKGGEDE